MQARNSSAGFDLFVRQPQASRWWSVGLVLLAGALQAASVAWPLSLPDALAGLGLQEGQPVWWLQTGAMALLVHLLLGSASVRQTAMLGWLFALTWLSLTFAWLYTSMHTYGGLAAPLAGLAVLGLAAVLALYYALICGLFRALALMGSVLEAMVFAALWLLAELARGVWLSGFGWGAVAYAQIDGPLAPLLAWVGCYGVGFAAAALAALLALAVRADNWRKRLVSLLVVLVAAGLCAHFPAPAGADAGTLSVTLLQGNIAQEEKFESATGVPAALRWYGDQLQASRSALIITPETALALLPEQLPDGYWHALQQRFATGEQAALVGLPLGSFTEGYTNSVVGFKPGQASAWRYDKQHLVPFGEFIPPLFRWFTNLMKIPLGDFNRGAPVQPTFDWQQQRLATTICYENLFGEEMARHFADPVRAPTLLVNISNLGWFGERLAMDQHLQIARARSLEFDRAFLLATNTGRTAIVDHLGRVTHALAPHTAAILSAQVQGRTGITPYAFWVSRWGLWPLWSLAAAVLLAAALSGRHRLRR
ncbi:MAG TPA: apolipoprotein N-acyltransferase [Rhodoferax sp.]|nr:apolipoprotein N-acyltransferase [Rhodoferax sp.]